MTHAPDTPRAARLGLGRKLVYAGVAFVAFFLVAELVLALAGMRPVLWDEDPYVGFASRVPLFVVEDQEAKQTHWVTASNKRAWFNVQRFASPKPPGQKRIFCLGGSTTYGRPYADATSFCGWMRELLQVADPSQSWELINAGGISYASYRVAAVMEELLEHEPDLFILYTGHNESLEHRTYRELIEAPGFVTDAGVTLGHTRVYAAVDALLSFATTPLRASDAGSPILPGEVETLLDHSIGPAQYARDDAQREREYAHYEFNVERMVEMARATGREVILVNPASNLKDCSPFKSEPSAELNAFKQDLAGALWERYEIAHAAGDHTGALGALEELLAIDDRQAEAHFRRGELLEELQRHAAARTSYLRARDEDICPLRARAPIGEILHSVAERRAVPLVDFARFVDERAENHLPGEAEFLDHVHLTIEGNRLLALEIIRAMHERGIVDSIDALSPEGVDAVARRVNSEIDAEAHGVALRNLAKVLSWAGKLDESERLAKQASELLGGDAESMYLMGASAELRGEVDAAIAHYQRASELDPGLAEVHNNLGTALQAQGRLAEAITHYRLFIELQPDSAYGHYNLAVALEGQGQPAVAQQHYREALRLKPDLERARLQSVDVAAAPVRMQDPDSARGADEALMAQSVEELFRTGNSLLSQKRFESAVRYYQEALRRRPNSGPAHGNLAVALQSLGRRDEAVHHFREVARLLPRDAGAHYNLGTALLEQSDLLEAMDHFETAAALRPGWDEPVSAMTKVVSTARASGARYALYLPELSVRANRASRRP